MRPSIVHKMIDLPSEETDSGRQIVLQAAGLLVSGFRDTGSAAWSDLDSALSEVREFYRPGRICRIAVDANEQAAGWIGGISHYDGHAWELHPLVVRPDLQRRGIGRLLVEDFESQVRLRGADTIYLGTDDEDGRTTLAGIDLYPNVWEHVARIRNLKNHPYEFYQRMGYAIIGVLPDANGPGKPDILMAKRVSPETNRS